MTRAHAILEIRQNYSSLLKHGACSHTIDPEQIFVDELAHRELDYYEINDLIEKSLGYRVTFV